MEAKKVAFLEALLRYICGARKQPQLLVPVTKIVKKSFFHRTDGTYLLWKATFLICLESFRVITPYLQTQFFEAAAFIMVGFWNETICIKNKRKELELNIWSEKLVENLSLLEVFEVNKVTEKKKPECD